MKKHHQNSASSFQLSTAIAEFLKHAELRHENIVQLYGLSLRYVHGSSDIEPLLVFAYMPGGTLEDWVFGGNHQAGWKESMKLVAQIGRDILQALCYLQGNSPPIVHGVLTQGTVMH